MAAVELELQTREAPAKESFAALLDESLGVASSLEGTVVKGRIIALENDAALIDVVIGEPPLQGDRPLIPRDRIAPGFACRS